MANLSKWILEQASSEAIEAVIIGDCPGWIDDVDGSWYGMSEPPKIPNYAQQPKGELLTWEQALPWIDYEFDDGHGLVRCNAVVAWTASKVISVYQYDGSVHSYCLPRNPVPSFPKMVGY